MSLKEQFGAAASRKPRKPGGDVISRQTTSTTAVAEYLPHHDQRDDDDSVINPNQQQRPLQVVGSASHIVQTPPATAISSPSEHDHDRITHARPSAAPSENSFGKAQPSEQQGHENSCISSPNSSVIIEANKNKRESLYSRMQKKKCTTRRSGDEKNAAVSKKIGSNGAAYKNRRSSRASRSRFSTTEDHQDEHASGKFQNIRFLLEPVEPEITVSTKSSLNTKCCRFFIDRGISFVIPSCGYKTSNEKSSGKKVQCFLNVPLFFIIFYGLLKITHYSGFVDWSLQLTVKRNGYGPLIEYVNKNADMIDKGVISTEPKLPIEFYFWRYDAWQFEPRVAISEEKSKNSFYPIECKSETRVPTLEVNIVSLFLAVILLFFMLHAVPISLQRRSLWSFDAWIMSFSMIKGRMMVEVGSYWCHRTVYGEGYFIVVFIVVALEYVILSWFFVQMDGMLAVVITQKKYYVLSCCGKKRRISLVHLVFFPIYIFVVVLYVRSIFRNATERFVKAVPRSIFFGFKVSIEEHYDGSIFIMFIHMTRIVYDLFLCGRDFCFLRGAVEVAVVVEDDGPEGHDNIQDGNIIDANDIVVGTRSSGRVVENNISKEGDINTEKKNSGITGQNEDSQRKLEMHKNSASEPQLVHDEGLIEKKRGSSEVSAQVAFAVDTVDNNNFNNSTKKDHRKQDLSSAIIVGTSNKEESLSLEDHTNDKTAPRHNNTVIVLEAEMKSHEISMDPLVKNSRITEILATSKLIWVFLLSMSIGPWCIYEIGKVWPHKTKHFAVNSWLCEVAGDELFSSSIISSLMLQQDFHHAPKNNATTTNTSSDDRTSFGSSYNYSVNMTAITNSSSVMMDSTNNSTSINTVINNFTTGVETHKNFLATSRNSLKLGICMINEAENSGKKFDLSKLHKCLELSFMDEYNHKAVYALQAWKHLRIDYDSLEEEYYHNRDDYVSFDRSSIAATRDNDIVTRTQIVKVDSGHGESLKLFNQVCGNNIDRGGKSNDNNNKKKYIDTLKTESIWKHSSGNKNGEFQRSRERIDYTRNDPLKLAKFIEKHRVSPSTCDLQTEYPNPYLGLVVTALLVSFVVLSLFYLVSFSLFKVAISTSFGMGFVVFAAAHFAYGNFLWHAQCIQEVSYGMYLLYVFIPSILSLTVNIAFIANIDGAPTRKHVKYMVFVVFVLIQIYLLSWYWTRTWGSEGSREFETFSLYFFGIYSTQMGHATMSRFSLISQLLGGIGSLFMGDFVFIETRYRVKDA